MCMCALNRGEENSRALTCTLLPLIPGLVIDLFGALVGDTRERANRVSIFVVTNHFLALE